MSDTKKSAYCGFQPYSYRDFTKQLRQLLQDRYTWDGDGFTILKELIQNANDDGATGLHLGWSPPLFDATSTSIGTGRSRKPIEADKLLWCGRGSGGQWSGCLKQKFENLWRRGVVFGGLLMGRNGQFFLQPKRQRKSHEHSTVRTIS